MHQKPGAAQEPLLLLFGHPPPDLDPIAGKPLQPVALRPIPRDYQAPPGLRPYLAPDLEQQVEALVGDKAAKSEEERLLRARLVGRGSQAGSHRHHADPLGRHPQLPEGGSGRRGNAEEQRPAIDARHRAILEGAPERGYRPRETQAPLLRAEVMDEADDGPAPP